MNADDIFQLLGAAPFGAYAVDLTQTVLFSNSGAERILGHRSQQVIVYPCYQVLAGTFGEGSPRTVCRDDHHSSLSGKALYPSPFKYGPSALQAAES
jgi:hypothetical protein